MTRWFSFFLFVLSGAFPSASVAQVPPDPAWLESARRLVPQGYVGGAAIRTDPQATTGILAVFRAGADDPKTVGNAFDWGHVLVVKLAQENGALKAVSGQLRERKPEPVAELKARPREISAATKGII